jgi:hypothetical protein
MKKRILGVFVLILVLQFLVIASAAETCELIPSLINQDPYPVIPGEPVKVVFQIDGIANSVCGDVDVELIESFPFILDKGYDAKVSVIAGTFVKDFESFLLAPYKIKIDEDALEGTSTLELRISSSTSDVNYDFDIEIEDVRTNFELSVKEYDSSTGILTFQILNIGENDVEALTVDVPRQDTLQIKGPARNIVGSLDSNDDTTFSFEAIPKDGDLKLIITYTDTINERRLMEKSVSFDSNLFDGSAAEKEGRSIWFYITLIFVIILIFRWYKNRKPKRH